ncbi:MAG: hypothetical protein K0B01_09165 [Syntrophobacterales bacterium]|nr:hypothetical protein [Syntrophobacterales bacterium]
MREKKRLAKRLCRMGQPAQADAPQILGDISSDRDSENPILEKLRGVDPGILAEFTKKEHPQTIALIMAHLLPGQAAEILECYSPTLQCEIIRRMAILKEVPLEFIEEVANTLEKEIPANASGERKLGGARFIGEILKKMGPASNRAVISALDKMEPEIASAVRNFMFSFDDVLKLDDKKMQVLLGEISSEDLSRALKLVDENARDKIYRNMPKRKAKIMKKKIRMMPPVRLADGESSQRKIIETIMKLEEAGKIGIRRGGMDIDGEHIESGRDSSPS